MSSSMSSTKPLAIDTSPFRYDGSQTLRLSDLNTAIDPLYSDKKAYKKYLKEYRKEINRLQNTMYAHDRYGALLLFQAMDAAGKDSTIQHVMSGINPHGVKVYAFKKPSAEELDHGFLWRTNRRMPARGTIHIFNRSYYEEVLVAKVHKKIVTRYQKLPTELHKDMNGLWESRYNAIRDMESYQHNNGFRTVKFFLNVSKEEQKRRFLARIDTPEKNWKFSSADIEERQHWDSYMQAYEQAINNTASSHCPWYVIPADDKKTMRLIVSAIVLEELQALDMEYPTLEKSERDHLQDCKAQLLRE